MLWIHEPRPEEKIMENVNKRYLYIVLHVCYVLLIQIDANFTIRPPPS